jgi:hypothetical protein
MKGKAKIVLPLATVAILTLLFAYPVASQAPAGPKYGTAVATVVVNEWIEMYLTNVTIDFGNVNPNATWTNINNPLIINITDFTNIRTNITQNATNFVNTTDCPETPIYTGTGKWYNFTYDNDTVAGGNTTMLRDPVENLESPFTYENDTGDWSNLSAARWEGDYRVRYSYYYLFIPPYTMACEYQSNVTFRICKYGASDCPVPPGVPPQAPP